MAVAESYDYIIAGAGSAGCVLANRLGEDRSLRILVLEAGGSEKAVIVDMPAALSIPMNTKRFNWGMKTEPEPGLDGREINLPRGKGLGGSSSINGMCWVRGNPMDYELWEALGADGWRWSNVLPYFQRLENVEGGGPLRGTTGPVNINRGLQKNPLYDAFVEAGVQAGYARSANMNERQHEGFGPMEMNIGDGRRMSAARALASMKNNDIDVFLGNWMPSMTLEMAPYNAEKSVDTAGLNLDDAGYGLVVPQYVADAGVKSLADIGAHKDKFKGKIYGIDPGDEGNRIISEMIADPKNNLGGFELIESSEAGMLTEAEKAMSKDEWVIFLAWTPHPIMASMKIHYLDGMGDSGFGSAKVYTLTRAGYARDCPNAGKLVGNLKFNLAMESAMMAPVLQDGADPKASALAWLKANPDAVKPWLEGVTTFDGGDAISAVAAALGK